MHKPIILQNFASLHGISPCSDTYFITFNLARYEEIDLWYRYSPSAAYGNNEVHIHPYKPRRISIAEALAIQSLPKEFELPHDITLSDAFKTVGNGVPYLAAKGIAQSLYDYLSK